MTTLPLTTPVLLLIFNRPEETAYVMDAIRAARPPRLYIAADGPREEKPGEDRLVEQARQVATTVEWPCDIHTRFLDANLGCKEAVSSGITWFFEQEPEGIILEDDTVPTTSFFHFCQELLQEYRDDKKVMSVSGMNSRDTPISNQYSYLFSRYPLMWGWASWRRAWDCYDKEMIRWPELRETDWLKAIGEGRTLFQKQWEKIFNECHDGEIDTWDFQWIYSCWLQNGHSILPQVNLVKNIGFGPEATHTIISDDPRGALETVELDFPLKHPPAHQRATETDRYLDKHWFQVEWHREVKRTLLKNPLIRALATLKRQVSGFFNTDGS